MKRYGSIYRTVISASNLHDAYLEARRGKMGRASCFHFSKRLGANLADLEHELLSGEYRPRPYCTFRVYEPKERLILAPAFRDIVVQHAAYRQVLPIFDRSFVDTAFACRVGRGTHAASDYIMNCVKESGPEAYYLQLDIRRYFHSIGRDMLRSQLERKLKEAALIDLLMGFAHNGQPVGVPIGNLLSQLFANIYLSPMDHWIKRDLKIRHYARYVDDLVLPGLSRRECEVARNRISRYLADRYGMELSRCVIEKQSRGINFCGYRMWVNKRLIRKHSLHRFRRRVRQSDLTAVVSLLGHAKRTSSLSHMTNYINEVNHELYQALPEDYRRSHNSPGPLRQPG